MADGFGLASYVNAFIVIVGAVVAVFYLSELHRTIRRIASEATTIREEAVSIRKILEREIINRRAGIRS